MLIDRLGMRDHGTKYPSPVTSSNNDRLPTTGDVHLYADPKTYNTQTPVLYADCEGLDGGETIPRGLRHRAKEKEDVAIGLLNDVTNVMSKGGLRLQKSGSSRPPSVVETSSRRKLHKSRHASQRDIVWAVTPETKKREYAVMRLYPRLLYTFSDVVVFVLRNPRAFESTVLDKLLEWGSASIDKSLNQPALPHAIIALNATDNVDDEEWDIESATKRLLDDISDAIYREPRFQEQAQLWRDTGRTIKSTKDLLYCYYASISVIRIPSRGRYMLMDTQMEKLFQLINKRCQWSLMTKKQLRMLATADKLQIYLRAAYDHFARDLSTPFDFIKEALKHNPIPQDFGGNILDLAISISQNSKDIAQKGGTTERIFEKMVPMISSCIMLDSVRQNLLGTTVQLLNDAYVEFCHIALEDFANFYAPCSYSSSRYGRCCNVKSGHSQKGHQNKEGRIFSGGGYQSDVNLQEFGSLWITQIRTHLDQLQTQLYKLSHSLQEQSENQIAARLHREQLTDFYRSLGNVTDFVSHSTCFSCLRELPEHPLPCGHVLCLPCIEAYGIKTSGTSIEVDQCPLHPGQPLREPPWTISIKPPHAGVRVLCLDGGGVRGIVELYVLKAIERVLGDGLRIQDFLDLIVGTSTGGIIALGLGVNNWSVDECINNFKELCSEAFTPRELVGIPVLEKLAIVNHGSMYKTKPFEALLKQRFQGNRPLFGGANNQNEMSTKVAVTSTTLIEQHPVILTNYNRPDTAENELPYRLVRSNCPSREFKVWEAARATAAAPPFFKTFTKANDKSGYVDGALYHNCPVAVAHHERRMIWADTANTVPDILLSIGTGVNTLEHVSQSPRHDPDFAKYHGTSSKPKKTFLPVQLGNIVVGRFDRLLACSTIWADFLTDIGPQAYHQMGNREDRRYIRVNPGFQFKVPRLDAVDSLSLLIAETRKYTNDNKKKIREIAHRLVASSFFFEKDFGTVRAVEDGFLCSGRIRCRFSSSPEKVKKLGYFFRGCLQGTFEPHFVLEEIGTSTREAQQIPVGETIINDMYIRGVFTMRNLRVFVSKELSTTNISLCLQPGPYPISRSALLPISGFPRDLMNEDIHLQGRHSLRLKIFLINMPKYTYI
ncbi:hypothetical protein CPLU01_06315 [Colletotrichum plurivorum]|uniref:Patatin-like phospholipase n=1 Tax=Colletotrichum plurivorum TaxID=2175906 RepID=A0A8H6NH14_9PEZI|nr:hypothetical protein CPLU01_06315 [Colletotrichum plurivorum]